MQQILNLEIKNVGQINRLHNTKGDWNEFGYNIPDAWEINMRVTELIPESRQIYDGVINDKILYAFKDPEKPAPTAHSVHRPVGPTSIPTG